MAKNVKTAAVKGRETKLNKKTSEDLIQIILRKDKTERNLNAQIVNLKAEVNSLNSRIKGYDKDMEGTEQVLESYKDRLSTYQEKIDSLKADIEDAKRLNDANTKLCKMWKTACISIAATAILVITFVLFM